VRDSKTCASKRTAGSIFLHSESERVANGEQTQTRDFCGTLYPIRRVRQRTRFLGSTLADCIHPIDINYLSSWHVCCTRLVRRKKGPGWSGVGLIQPLAGQGRPSLFPPTSLARRLDAFTISRRPSFNARIRLRESIAEIRLVESRHSTLLCFGRVFALETSFGATRRAQTTSHPRCTLPLTTSALRAPSCRRVLSIPPTIKRDHGV
jgi:hypothetical protein